MYRVVVLERRGRRGRVEIQFHLEFADSGRCRDSVHLKPSGCIQFPAARFYDCNLRSGMPAAITVLLNGVEAPQLLTPQIFLRYVKIIFYVDENNRLTITGVKPKLYDICRLRGFGFFGREYRGRKEEPIEEMHSQACILDPEEQRCAS